DLVIKADGGVVLTDGKGFAPGQAAVGGLADQYCVFLDHEIPRCRRRVGCQGNLVEVAVGSEGEPSVGGALVGSPGNQGDPRNPHLLPDLAAVEADTGDDSTRGAVGPQVLHPDGHDIPRVCRVHGHIGLAFAVEPDGPRLTADVVVVAGEWAVAGDLN